jgi:hypothetical protein
MPKQKIFKYRVKRDCYDDMTRYRPGQIRVVDVANEGIPSHHFEPLDGGPVQPARKGSLFARQDKQLAARKKAAEDAREPETFHAISRQQGKAVGQPARRRSPAATPVSRDAAAPVNTKNLPATPTDIDMAMKFSKPMLIAIAKRDGKSVHGSKVDISRRLIGVESL